MKTMKTTVKTRTPRRVLAVFLSVLMLMSSLVFASPTVSKAAGRVTFDESKYGNYQAESKNISVICGRRGGLKNGEADPWGNYYATVVFSFNATNFSTIIAKDSYKLIEGKEQFDIPDYSSGPSIVYDNVELYSFYDYRQGVKNYGQSSVGGVTVSSVKGEELPFQTTTYFIDDYDKPVYYEAHGTPHYDNRNDVSYAGDVYCAPIETPIPKVGEISGAITAKLPWSSSMSRYFCVVNVRRHGKITGTDGTHYHSYLFSPIVKYCGINSTELYNLYKDLYVGYYGGFYTVTPVDKFANAMYAADAILQGKIDDKIKQTYGYSYICQELLDAIVADLKAVDVKVTFSSTIVTSSDPADAATFNTIPTPSNYKDGLNVTVNVNTAKYNLNNPRLVVEDDYGVLGEYSLKHSSGSTYTCNVPINGDIKRITAKGFKVKQYTVTVPSTRDGLKITGGGNTTVDWGSNYTFTVEVRDGYTRSTPNVKIGNTPVDCTKNGNIYTYTISSIKENKNVTIDNLSLNEYSVSYNLGTGTGKTSDSVTKLVHGKNGTVKITVGDAYTQRKPEPTVDKGAKLTPVSNDGKTYVYTLSGVTDDVTVTVPSLNKNTYTAVLPSGEGYTAKSNDDLANIVYGSSISFGIDLDEQYNRSTVVVKYNGTVLEPAGGVYTISNITNNITKDMITVEGVKLNDYYIALPLESQPGFTIEVGEGLNAKAVRSGTSFNFKLFLDPAYSQSDFTIKYSKDGGEHYTVLEKDANGSYVIEPVLSDYIVVVDGVKKNTYTVKFLDPDGNVDETVADVEYGSAVEYPGESEPTKANDPVSDTIDPETGIRTVIEKKYTFVGWSQDTSNVTSDMTVSPIFEVSEVKTTYPKEGGTPTVVVTPKTANVLFISDGIIVHKETVEKGTKFSGWDGTPVKTSKNPYETYKFIGWDLDKDGVVDVAAGESNAIDSVKDDVMFVAVFESNLPSQTVTFKNFDGSEVLYSAKVKRGEEAKYELPGSPVRRDNTNLYDFAGWSLEKDADETKIVEKVLVAESDITLYAAYKKTPIVYSYKYINDGTVLQEGTFNNGDYYAYLGATPTREPTASTVYTFKTWKVVQSGYDTVYTAVYSEAVREYETKLPASTEAFDITDNATVKYGETFTFTVTLKEGYEETAPNVTSAGKEPKLVSTDGNSYTYEIKLDGATYEDVVNDLTVSVGTTINNYDVIITGDEGCEVVPTSINSDHGGNGSFTVTLREGYTQTDPTVTVDGKLVLSAPEIGDGKYVYTISEIKSDATITVTTKINEYRVIVYNWKNEAIFNKNVKHGSTPDIKTPVKPADKNGAYEFIGYDTNNDGAVDVKVIENVTAPVTAKALYKYNHRHDTDPDENPDIWELVETDKATCERDGLKHYVCRHGDGQTTTKVIPARKHNMTDWHIDKAPTCTETGLKSRHCQNTGATDEYEACSYAENGVVIPATGHHDSDGDYKCDDCGADLGHCSSCICHKGNVLSKVIRKICTILSKTFHTKIKCCKCMKWYGDEISSIS